MTNRLTSGPTRHTRPAAHPRREAALDLAAWVLLPAVEALDDFASWLADQKPSEIAYQAVRALIWITIGAAIVISLAARQPQHDQPGTPLPADAITIPSAVKVVQP
jgi:hypothetical protein